MWLSFRGRLIREADVVFLRELIRQNPGLTRRRLSVRVCAAWNWVQPNGQPRDMVCRGLLLALHRAGQIELPAKRQSPPRQLHLRDQFVGAPQEAYRHHLHRIAYNTRYLILPWVRVPHLASHLLGRMAGRISADWQALYHHPVDLLESFVDTERFRGACYQAANWICLGHSGGRGTKSKSHQPACSIKELWVYPLSRNFRQRLLQSP